MLEEAKYDDAIKMYEEALGFDKWKDLYGSTILSSLGKFQKSSKLKLF